jgi:hypothetical protein
MKLYKIDTGIKVPKPSRPKLATSISRAAATMQKLAAGESFLVADPLDAMKAEKSMRDMNGSERTKRKGRHFASRRLEKGLRIWRTR